MSEIAILGYGTVGTGVVEVLHMNRDSIEQKAQKTINIKYILDLRDFPGDVMEDKITHDFNDILNDPDIDVVVEVMGGEEPAYTYVKNALLKGKNVVSSNKALVAKHGAELLAIAKEKNKNFMFEASVGGGIPIIRPLSKSLSGDKITEITGILNGTTNFILTKMAKEGRDFDEVLKQAQNLGYAEQDPSADVEGWDTCRKTAILLSLAMGKTIDYEGICTEGIVKISAEDMKYASKMDSVIKLLGVATVEGGRAFARVSPMILSKNHPLAMVEDVFNGVFIKANALGEAMFYGRGAGSLPTASAVMADIVDVVVNENNNIMGLAFSGGCELLPMDMAVVSKLVRVKYNPAFESKAMDKTREIFGNVDMINNVVDGEFAFITGKAKEKKINDKIKILTNSQEVMLIPNTIRLRDDNDTY